LGTGYVTEKLWQSWKFKKLVLNYQNIAKGRQLNMEPGQAYHIYNHANGRENLFVEERNYSFFLGRLAEYLLPVCRLYAYCLMKNHFHLFARIRFEDELKRLWNRPQAQLQLNAKELILKTSKAFSNLFSSYTQSFNKLYKRMGSLFIPSMKCEHVEGDESFKRVVHYIHANPVHHGFVPRMGLWRHSSYNILLGNQKTILEREYVLNAFGGLDKFIEYHSKPIDKRIKWIDD
jgi:REP element-mobilizing transposase RayT